MELRTEKNNVEVTRDLHEQSKITIDKLNNEIASLQRQVRSVGGDNEKLNKELQNAIQEKDSEIERLKSNVRMLEIQTQRTTFSSHYIRTQHHLHQRVLAL